MAAVPCEREAGSRCYEARTGPRCPGDAAVARTCARAVARPVLGDHALAVIQEAIMQRALVLVLIAVLAHTAAAGERAGVTMPDAVTIDGKPLALNGIGIRKATIFHVKVYVAGLYLEKPSHSAEEILRSVQVKRLDMVLLRDVDRDDIVDVWRKGLKKNGADMAKLKGRFDRFASWMSDMNEQDSLSFLYVPERGVTVTLKGQVKGTIAGTDFASALFAIWLGADPADEGLRDRLLGKD